MSKELVEEKTTTIFKGFVLFWLIWIFLILVVIGYNLSSINETLLRIEKQNTISTKTIVEKLLKGVK